MRFTNQPLAIMRPNTSKGKYNKANSLLHEKTLPRKKKIHGLVTPSFKRTLGLSDGMMPFYGDTEDSQLKTASPR